MNECISNGKGGGIMKRERDRQTDRETDRQRRKAGAGRYIYTHTQ